MGKRTTLCVWLAFALLAFCAFHPPTTTGAHYQELVDYMGIAVRVVIAEAFVFALYITWARPADRKNKNDYKP